MADEATNNLLELTSEIVSSHVANNRVHAGDVPNLITSVYQALSGLGAEPAAPAPQKPQGAVSARKSLGNSGHILSMIDGRPYKMLRRHISQHGYTPDSYRETFGLPRDYPMTAPDYAEQRRSLAHKIGLGRRPKAEAPASPVAEPRRGRKPKADGTAAAMPAPRKRGVAKALGDAVASAKEHLGRE